MNEKPILFNGEMVRAILSGQKTQTRRVIKPQPTRSVSPGAVIADFWIAGIPYNVSKIPFHNGDRLWVRETWRAQFGDDVSVFGYRADNDPDECGCVHGYSKWKPSIFMPRSASRITLEVVNVRVEKVQDISEEDATAEGVWPKGIGNLAIPKPNTFRFQQLWDSINEKRGHSWDSNPWVWVVEFRRIK